MTEHPRTVAIVDDDPSVRRGLKRLLQTQQWEVCLFASAEEFLDRDVEPTVHLALVDIYLPGMNGVELLKCLHLKGNAPPVILMTAHGQNETADVLRSAGQVACLRKPFTLQQLLDVAERYRWTSL